MRLKLELEKGSSRKKREMKVYQNMTQLNKQKHRKLGGNLIALERKKRRQFKLIVKERITSVDQKDRLDHICYANDSIIVWTSIFGEAYNKNVTSFLKEDLLRFNIMFNIKKANLTYIISNRIDLFLRSENIYEKSPKCAYN
jgi:hypothetical protein